MRGTVKSPVLTKYRPGIAVVRTNTVEILGSGADKYWAINH